MSTSPENQLVNVLSHWLARHVGDQELQREVDALDLSQFNPMQTEAVQELQEELAKANGGGGLEMVVRETLEAVALG